MVDPRRAFIGFMFNELGQEHRARITQALRHLGLTSRLMGALSLLRANGPLSQVALGGLLRVDRTTVVQMVDRLEGLGFVERRASSADRRQNALVLTRSGDEALDEALTTAAAVEVKLSASLSAEELTTLRALLNKLMDAAVAR